jgi:putative ATP-dependent endonuclease of the OLD family
MRLARLTLTNFGSCEDAEVVFAEDLTVIVGENAAGKSAVIDALRLLLPNVIPG